MKIELPPCTGDLPPLGLLDLPSVTQTVERTMEQEAAIRAGILRVCCSFSGYANVIRTLPGGHKAIAERFAPDIDCTEYLIEGPDMPVRNNDGTYQKVFLSITTDPDMSRMTFSWLHKPGRSWTHAIADAV